ncbi:MAG: periplasmic heavy metal sensor [Gemmatimonadota bacterium]
MIGSTWRASLLLGAVFAGGAVVGGAVVSHVHPATAGANVRGHNTEEFLRLLTDSLALSTEQRDGVRKILDRHRPAADSLWSEIELRFETLRSSVRSEIRSQLTPEQQHHFTDLMTRRDLERRRTDR